MITTYSELQTAIADHTHRDDVAAKAEEFIQLAESRLLKVFRSNPVTDMEANTDLVTVAGTETVALPTGWIANKDIYLDTDPKTHLEPVSLAYMRSVYGGSETGKPIMYAVNGGNLVFAPVPDAVYTIKLTYYKFDTLSDSNITNWLLESHPDLYLSASLMQAYLWTHNTQKATEYDAVTSRLIEELVSANNDIEFSGSPLVIRTA